MEAGDEAGGNGRRAPKDLLMEEILGQLTRQPDNYRKIIEGKTESAQRSIVAALAEEIFDRISPPAGVYLTRALRHEMTEHLFDELFGYGPIHSLVIDPEITEIMVNGPDRVFIEREGRVEAVETHFRDAEHLKNLIDRIVWRLGRRIDESSPMVDARLSDGSRVNASIAPIAIGGPFLTIRKFLAEFQRLESLAQRGSIDQEMIPFLRHLVHARFNIVISGGTGAGKTTFLNLMANLTPPHERLVTIEDSAELHFDAAHDNVCSFEARPSNVEGRGAITIRELIHNSLRMRPDRLIVGEVRGAEALDMLQAMNTGHEGSFTTVHANAARDLVSRLETMVCMAATDLSIAAVRTIIVSALHIVIQVSRLSDGSRKVVEIAEVTGLGSDGRVMLTPLWTFETMEATADDPTPRRFRRHALPARTRRRLEEAGLLERSEANGTAAEQAAKKVVPTILEQMRRNL
jgi:pilus assembly protein CpaF